ncbi:hypothetical protein MP228_001192 [Amoeboaphelidium protococcarum]|nr:hypothetical protein MP228_001192 [Amoeboaphelidium protococcarum]
MPEPSGYTANCHGRVTEEDFEHMVPAQWWKSVFADDLYLKTDGDVVEDAEITKEELRMLESNPKIAEIFQRGSKEASVNGGDLQHQSWPKVLDLCCGQGRHTLLLAERYPNLRLYGHDQSAYLISLARERATNLPDAPYRQNVPTFTVGDCRNVPYDSNDFDFVMVMGNSFGYFSANDRMEVDFTDDFAKDPVETVVDHGDEGDRAVLREINRMLKIDGKMVLDLVDGDYMRQNYSPRSWEWIDDKTFVCRERVLSKDKKRLHSREVVTMVNRGVVRDQFYSERLYSRSELISILNEAGFQIDTDQAAVVQDGVNTVTAAKEMSQRGQDLGMMEQRLLIQATKIQNHPRAISKRKKGSVKGRTQAPHPQMSAENAQAVREWIERLSLQEMNSGFENDLQSIEYKKAVIEWIESCTNGADSTDTSSVDSLKYNNGANCDDNGAGHGQQFQMDQNGANGNQASTNNVLREWIDRVILPPSSHIEPPSSSVSYSAKAKTITLATPSLYHLLPPPPFPNHQLSVLLGDVSLPCRDKLHGRWNEEDLVTRRKMIDALLDCGYDASQITIYESHRDLVTRLTVRPPSFILNLCDEGFLNDAHKELHIASFLEMCGIPYSGANPVSLGVCYDKGFVNATASKLGISVPQETHIILPESVDTKDVQLEDIVRLIEAEDQAGNIRYPAFVKPMKGDNSLGITSKSICYNKHDLAVYVLSLVSTYGLKQFIIQEYLTGTEYSVGVIGNPETGFHFFPILQVDYSKVVQGGLEPILGWESKWDPSSPYWTDVDFYPAKRIPSPKLSSCNSPCGLKNGGVSLGQQQQQQQQNCASSTQRRIFKSGGLTLEEEEELKRACTILFERFGCRDYARFDWRADREILYDVETGDLFNVANNSNGVVGGDESAPNNITITTQGVQIAVETSAQSSSENKDEIKSLVMDNSTESSLSVTPDVRLDMSDSGHGSVSSVRSPSSVIDSASVGQASGYEHGASARKHAPKRSIKLLEVNPNPGWCWDGKLAKMAAFEGMSYPDLLKCILWASWERSFGHSKGEGRRLLADWCANAIRGERVSMSMSGSKLQQPQQ